MQPSPFTIAGEITALGEVVAEFIELAMDAAELAGTMQACSLTL